MRALPTLLDAHRDALAACRRCGHDDAGARPIISGAPRPRAMLVGQAPGKTEDMVDRRPFSGRAGRTLFRWMARAGIDEPTFRDNVYIAAITRCYPGPHPSGRGDRVPSPRERDLCASWLDDELRLIRPPLLLLVGRMAIDRFVGPAPLDRLVGAVVSVQHAGGPALAVPLPHPSGASSWIHAPGHAALLDRALVALRGEFARLGLAAAAPRQGAA